MQDTFFNAPCIGSPTQEPTEAIAVDVGLLAATSNLPLTTNVSQSRDLSHGLAVVAVDPAAQNLQSNMNIPRTLVEGCPIEGQPAAIFHSPEPAEHARIRAACRVRGIPCPVVAVDFSFSDMPVCYAGDELPQRNGGYCDSQHLYARPYYGESHSSSMDRNDPGPSTAQETELAILCQNLTLHHHS